MRNRRSATLQQSPEERAARHRYDTALAKLRVEESRTMHWSAINREQQLEPARAELVAARRAMDVTRKTARVR